MVFALLTGGEVMTYKGWEEIYKHLLDIGVYVRIKTNGLLLNEKNIDFFKKYTPYGINISVYGGSEDAYEAVTGFRVFSKVRENIELAKKANLPINIALTLSHHMLPYFKETIEYIYSTNLNCGMSPFPHQANENTGRNFNTYNVSLEEAISCIEQKLELEYKKNGDLLKKTANYKDGDIKKGLLCGAGICSCCIGWDGYMHACANYRGLGYNAVEIGVKKAWKMLSKTVSSYEIPGQCCKCELFKEKHCTFCPIEHGCKFGEKFKVNNEICSRRKKIYSKFNLEKNK